MALIVGQATVATGMSPIVEAGLYADAIFIDGVTFTSEHNVTAAGQIQVQVAEGGRGNKPVQPGSKMTDREFANHVVEINCNNGYTDSASVPDYYGTVLPNNVMMPKTLEVTMKTAGGRQESALAVLVGQGTASDDTTAITKDNIAKILLDLRESLRKKHVKPDVVILSVSAYTAMLQAAGDKFTPAYNDDVVRAGKVGYWMGFLIIEADLLDGTTDDYTYLDAEGKAVVVDTSDVDLIMYNHLAFSIIDKLVGLRVIPDQTRFGSLVQAEIDCGFKVTNADCVLVKKTA